MVKEAAATTLRRKVLRWWLSAFVLPPFIWLLALRMGRVVDSAQEFVSVLTNPSLIAYCLFFIGASSWLALKMLGPVCQVLRLREEGEEPPPTLLQEAQRCLHVLPRAFWGVMVLYCFFGPLSGMWHLDFIDPVEFRIGWAMGVPALLVPAVPLFMGFLRGLEEGTGSAVALSGRKSLSLKARFLLATVMTSVGTAFLIGLVLVGLTYRYGGAPALDYSLEDGGLMFAVCVAMALATMAVAGRNIFEPILEATRALKAIASGELDLRDLPLRSRDETAELALAVNDAKRRIKDRIEYMEALKRGIPDPFFMVDREMRITFFNQALSRLSGLRPEEVLGKPCHEVMNTELCGANCPVKESMATGKAVSGLRLRVNLGGRDVPMMMSASTLRDADGKVIGAFEILKDMTFEEEQKRREEESKRRYLKEKVQELSAFIQRLAAGDFSADCTMGSGDEALQMLARSLNEMVSRLRDLLHQVHQAADQVATASAQVAEASQRLAEGASEQAASVEQISASVQQVASTARNNAEGVTEGDRLMKETSQVVEQTSNSMEELSRAIEEIASSSERTRSIVKTIDEIAFQTNLLALNAAVEAARAGEAGAGFAVVADEVRNLAQKSAEAARETAKVLQTMASRVKDGRDVLRKASDDFASLTEYAQRVIEIMSAIASASQQQAQEVEQVRDTLSRVEEVTQRVAANAEESAAAAEEMKAQSEELKRMVANFKLAEEKGEERSFQVLN